MGESKRRGTYEQRKEQRFAKQYGLTNAELATAYRINRKYNLIRLYNARRPGKSILEILLRLL